MYKPLLISLCILLSFVSFSQEKIDVGLFFNYAYPTSDHGIGDKGDPRYIPPGMGFGGSLDGNYWFAHNFSAGLEAGYLTFMDEATSADGRIITTNAAAIPIMAKATVYLGGGIVKPYLELGAGYSLYTQTQSTLSILPTGPSLTETKWDQSGAIVSPRLGLKVDFTDQLSMKVNVQYNQMINKIDGDKELEVTVDGETTTLSAPGLYANNVGYLGINIGVTYTLFDYFGRF